MARNQQQGTKPKPDFAAMNANSAKIVGTALAVIDTQLGSGTAAKYNAARLVDDLKWSTEKAYVKQIFERSELLCKALLESPYSLPVALQSAAALGLTLDPNQSLAFLVPQRPRQGAPYEVVLKVSYKGMEQAVLASGTVTAIQTELVYENDEFDYGVNIDGPYLTFKMARGDRGALTDCFCLARYANGEKHVEVMSAADLAAVEEAAFTFGNGKAPAWAGHFKPEMQKKSCVRRASKHWPKSPVLAKLAQVYDTENLMVFETKGGVIEGELVAPTLGDIELAALDEALAALPEEQRAKWYLMKAQAEGYPSIRDVPLELFEKVKADLTHRLGLFQKNRQPQQEGAE